MDDGVASSSSIGWFVVLLLLEMLFYSFDSAFQYRKEEEQGEDGEAGGTHQVVEVESIHNALRIMHGM